MIKRISLDNNSFNIILLICYFSKFIFEFKLDEKDCLIFKLIKMEQQISSMMPWLIPVIIILAVWDSVWKLIAMWKSARKDQLAWFICLAIFNTIGILPIVYLLIHKKRVNIREIA